MARRTTIIESVTCDLCGKDIPSPATITLGWGRDQWELDLCEVDNASVGATFDTWVGAGRKVSRRGPRGSGGSNGDTQAIREWAKAHKMKVGDKGRISAEVRAAYAAATR